MEKTATAFPRFSVTVSGLWTDPLTGTETTHEETYRVLALREDQATVAGMQMFGAAAAAKRFRMSGECTATCT